MERTPSTELSQKLVRAYADTFIPRRDLFAIQTKTGTYTARKFPLKTKTVWGHVRGHLTLGTYALDADSQASWICFDADEREEFVALSFMAHKLQGAGVAGYLEHSRRGGHLWFFTDKMPGADARCFGKQLISDYDLPEEIELFPKQDKLKTGPGSLMRLPLGIHRKTDRRYHFITPQGEPIAPTIRDQIAILADPQKVSQTFIDRILETVPEVGSVSPSPSFDNLKKGQGETLSEVIKSRISVIDFVGKYVELDAQRKGLCPFHDDTHKSFQVSEDGNFWNCYADCGGGSIIDFWIKMRGSKGEDSSFQATITDLRHMLL